MACCGGDREKQGVVKNAQKWDYINLSDFHSTSCFTPLSYGVLWILLGVSVACYVADFSTMINLLLWDKYGTNGITPPAPWGIEAIPRWVFTGCIILSYVLLIYRWMKALRAMRSGGVAKSYLDPLAVRIQAIRPGKRGRGYRRFLVFAELTKSKHGTEYIALFVYFAFEAWLRILFAEGPRNVINGYTIYHLISSWANTSASPDQNKNDSGIQKFWAAAQAAANDNKIQAAVFVGMVFTCIIWLIAFIGLIVATVLYIMFLWHHIPSQDGGLRGYCKRKVDKSLERIISKKIKTALEQEQKAGFKKEAKAGKGALPSAPADLKRQPTLPVLGDDAPPTIPPFGARPGTPGSILDREPALPDMASNFSRPSRPGMPGRAATTSSNKSYGSDAPLLGDAAEMGRGQPGRAYSPAPGSLPGRSYSPVNGRSASPAPPARPFTPTGELIMDRAASPGPQRMQSPLGGPQRSFTPGTGTQRSFTPAGPPPFVSGGRPPMRQNTGLSEYSTGRASPAPGQPRELTPVGGGPQTGRPTPGPMSAIGAPRSGSAMSGPTNGRLAPLQAPARSDTAGPYNSQGRQSPASFSRPGAYNRPAAQQTPVQEFEMTPQSRQGPPSINPNPRYQAYKPDAVSSPSTPANADRSLLDVPDRAETAPPSNHGSTYGASIYDHYADSDGEEPHPMHRAATAGPGGGSGPEW